MNNGLNYPRGFSRCLSDALWDKPVPSCVFKVEVGVQPCSYFWKFDHMSQEFGHLADVLKIDILCSQGVHNCLLLIQVFGTLLAYHEKINKHFNKEALG